MRRIDFRLKRSINPIRAACRRSVFVAPQESLRTRNALSESTSQEVSYVAQTDAQNMHN